VCDPVDGTCSAVVDPDGTPATTVAPVTSGEACAAGACTGGSPSTALHSTRRAPSASAIQPALPVSRCAGRRYRVRRRRPLHHRRSLRHRCLWRGGGRLLRHEQHVQRGRLQRRHRHLHRDARSGRHHVQRHGRVHHRGRVHAGTCAGTSTGCSAYLVPGRTDMRVDARGLVVVDARLDRPDMHPRPSGAWTASVCPTYASCGVWHDVTSFNDGENRCSVNFLRAGHRLGGHQQHRDGAATAVAPRACGWGSTVHPLCEIGQATYSVP